jgi:hypothetical protein
MKMLSSLASPASAIILGAFALAVSVPVHADPVAWTNWSSQTSGNPGSASGTMAGTTVTYSGQTVSLSSNYPSFDPSSSYTSATIDNAPPSSDGVIQMYGGLDISETITFSAPVVNPIIAIWSLGAVNDTASFDFTSSEPFTIVAGGPSSEYGGASIYQGTGPDSENVYGQEGNGVIELIGTYSTIDFTTPGYENWYGFTVGEDTVLNDPPSDPPTVTPEPGTLSLFCLGLGLASLPVLRNSMARRRLEHKA